MTDVEQTIAFANEIQAVCERFRQEFHITAATAVGVLHIQAAAIIQSTIQQIDAGEGDNEGEEWKT